MTRFSRLRTTHRLHHKFARVTLLAAAGVVATATVVFAGTLTGHSLIGGGVTSMTISGVAGSGTTRGPNYIEVESWSWGVANIGSQSSGAGAGRSGRANVSDFTITKKIDRVSPLLFNDCALGTNLGTITIYMDPPGSGSGLPGGDSQQITLTSARVTKITDSSDPGGQPIESVTLNFAKIEFKYAPQDGSSSTRFGWNIKTNKPG
jgi:type VI secretion system secreted protein Hcp